MEKRLRLFWSQKLLGILVYLILFPLVAINCGGGGGGGDDGEGTTPNVNGGVFVDSKVGGIDFETDTQSGETDENGTFTYLSGETVAFSIGNLILGSATGQSTITPVDLVPGATDETDSTVTNIAKLLQGLDQDGDPTNGIVITDAVEDIVSDVTLDFEQDTDDFEMDQAVQDMMDALNDAGVFADVRDLPTDAAVQEHLKDTLADLEGTDGGDGENESLVAEVQTDLGNDGDIDSSRTYTYNADGTVQRIDFDDSNDGTYDRYSEYTYDDHGNWLSVTTEFMGHVIGSEYDHTYNASDQLTRTEVDNLATVGVDVDEIITYTYDSNGNKIKEESDLLGDETVDSVFTFEYDSSGNKTKINQDIDNDGTIELITVNSYNSGNKLIKVELDGELQPGDDLPDGTPDSVSTYTYDTSGRIEKLETDYDNDGVIDTVDKYIYE